MKFIRALLTVVCILIAIIAVLCLLSELGGGGPSVVYAVQTNVL